MGGAKHRDTTAVAADVCGVGEARLLGFGKCSAASVSESELAESFDEGSSGEEALHWIAEYNVQDLVETVKNGGKGQHLPGKDCRMEWRPRLHFLNELQGREVSMR